MYEALSSKITELDVKIQEFISNTEKLSYRQLAAGQKNREELTGLTFSAALREEMARIKDLFDRLRVKLNIVIVGQFNSGKSTFINSLLRREIAMVDETEMTYSLNYLTFGETEKATIQWKNGTTESLAINKVNQMLKENRDQSEFRERIETVMFQYPYRELENINIWDTPGLGSLTKENRERTSSIIQEADVVIWVIDVTALGDASDRMEMERVKNLGKPILLVINKMDLVDTAGAKAEIDEYLNNCYHGLFNKIFYVSSLKEWQSVLGKEPGYGADSGINLVRTYLTGNIFKKKQEIITATFFYDVTQSLQKLLELIEGYQDRLANDVGKIEEFEEELRARAERIIPELQEELRKYVRATLLEKEYRELLARIEKKRHVDEAEFKKLMAAIISDEVINGYVKDAENCMRTILRQKWEIVIGRSAQHMQEQDFNFQGNSSSEVMSSEGSPNLTHEEINDIFTAAGFLAGLSLVTAILFGASAVILAPLTFLLAAISYAAFDNKYEIRRQINQAIMDYRQQFITEIVDHWLIEDAKKKNEGVLQEIVKKVETKYLPFGRRDDYLQIIEAARETMDAVKKTMEFIDEEKTRLDTGVIHLFEERIPRENFIILRDNPGPGVEILEHLLDSAQRYVYIIDPYFGVRTLAWLERINSYVSVKILLYNLENQPEEQVAFFSELRKLRQNRQAPIKVRAIKYKNRRGTPIHDRYIFTENWGINLGNGLDAIGKQDINCSFLANPQANQKILFDKYWISRRARFPDKEEEVVTRDL